MTSSAKQWPRDLKSLTLLGYRRVCDFCELNKIAPPNCRIVWDKSEWTVNSCAFWRPNTEVYVRHNCNGINICPSHCAYPCGDAMSRAWSWPGSTTDRTPYGVVCHELGHHCDYLVEAPKAGWWGVWCQDVMNASKEPPVGSYAAENPSEYLAEAFRIFVTNPKLLQQWRPKTYAEIKKQYKPMPSKGWKAELKNAPDRVVRALINKGLT